MTRPFLFLICGYAATLLVATLRQLVPVVAFVPDPGLLFVLYLGVTPRQSAPTGAAAVCVLGYLTDLLSAAPKGTYALVYVLLFLLARVAQLRLLTRGRVFEVWFSCLLAGLGGFAVTLIRSLAAGSPGVRGVAVIALQALATGLTAPVVFSLGRRLDRWTSRVPEATDRSSTVKVLMK
ncbi:MAG TPA: rod shape-determining protein MreD [Polyangia bacterium]|jgi:rod shape-determining protein MreD